LNQTFDIEKSVLIPLNISYWTDTPDYLLGYGMTDIFPRTVPFFDIIHYIGSMLFIQKNKILFGNAMPSQYIYINITDKPLWANTTILCDIIPVEIPTNNISSYDPEKNSSREIALINQTNLIISPFEEAPSQQYTITISIETPERGMVKHAIFYERITFTPKFNEKIEIKIEEPLRFAQPNTAVNFNITVFNKGNKRTKITPEIKDDGCLHDYIINPQCIEIPEESSRNFVFSCTMPNEFGWHDDIKKIRLQFTAETFPLDIENEKGEIYEIELSVNSFGLALAGFETLHIVSAIFLICIIYFYKRKLKKRDRR
jgi:hypothetical protein